MIAHSRSIFLKALWVVLAAVAFAQPASAKPKVTTYVSLNEPLAFGEYFWNEEGAPRGGAIRVVVDLDAEQLYVYRGGYEIARAAINRGWEEYETPTGTFPVLEKDADHYSSKYDNAPMPYNLRLTWGGVAIHGSEVWDYAATHGCIGVPTAFAAKLFQVVKKGNPIYVTRNWLPQYYADNHPRYGMQIEPEIVW